MKPLEDMGRFATVVIDPPWPMRLASRYEKRRSGGFPAAELPYGSLSLEAIAALPVPAVLAEDAFLFCWAPAQFVFDVPGMFDSWGVRKRDLMCWHKPNGMQIPNRPKSNGEYVVVGTTGRPVYSSIKAYWTVNSWPARGHSVKPDEFYETVRRVAPGPRLDIFGRRAIEGFASWGDEAPA